MEHLRLTR